MSGTWITAEWLSPIGGSERVVEHLGRALPDAQVFSPVVFAGGAPGLARDRVHGVLRRPERLLARRELSAVANAAAWPVFGRTVARRADLVVASHHLASHWSAIYSDVPHLGYVHTPARYAWYPEIDDRASSGAGRALAAHIRRMDTRAARRVASYAANSETTRARIAEVWDRDAVVIHPPVDLGRFESVRPSEGRSPYLLGLSRFISYKRLDFAIEVADRAGIPLVLVGSGVMEAELRTLAERVSVPVDFVTGASDAEVAQLMADAAALVYPALEDFGLVPVEAMAAGTPVLALAQGGTAETVVDGVTGFLFPELDPGAWAARVPDLERLRASDCRDRASAFAPDAFADAVRRWVERDGR